jgi:uncharacterized protein YndB with AHSA1/START domain
MLPKSETACFVIADISGYTTFISGVELDHAHDIIADIMDTLLGALRPAFRLAKFEGDAAFVYAVADRVDGSLLQDAIESAYFAFRKRLRSIKQATSCECQACRAMQSLDVKFVVHHGEFIKHKMAGQAELAGRDVILVHRLLKNDVNKKLDGHAYALYSEACVRAMGIDPAEQGLAGHEETLDGIGETKCWLRDLEQAWTRENEAARILVDRHDAARLIERDFEAPPPAVWEFVTAPAHHKRWQRADGFAEATVKGRRGAGTQNHCMHGKNAIIEDILDWRPFDYVTLTALLPIPGAAKLRLTYSFERRADGGTHLELRFGKPKPKDLPFFEQVWPTVQSNFDAGLGILRSMLEERATSDVAEEPPLPVSRERFFTQPVPSR